MSLRMKVMVANGMFPSERCISFRRADGSIHNTMVSETALDGDMLEVWVVAPAAPAVSGNVVIGWPHCMDPERAVVPWSALEGRP